MTEHQHYTPLMTQNNMYIELCRQKSRTKQEFVELVGMRFKITNEETFTNIYWKDKDGYI